MSITPTPQLDIIALTVIVESRPLWVLILALTAMLASMLPPPGVLSVLSVLWEPMLRRQVCLFVPMPIWATTWTRWGLPHNRNAKLGTMLVRQALPRVWHVLVLLTKDGSTQKQAPQNALILQLMHSIQKITKIE